MKDVQEKQPNRFGPNGKMSSAYSLTNFTWNLGLLFGPIISGSLTRTVGYYYMNLIIGTIVPPNSRRFLSGNRAASWESSKRMLISEVY